MTELSTPSYLLAPTPSVGMATHLAMALLLGMVIIYGVEFSDSPLAHNAAHDVRHANGRPCH
jgi:cobalt transporter subunit CbtB